jgi:GntR family transcriptional regulator
LPLRLSVDARSGYPIYLQLVGQIERAVAIGVLAPGEQLPTVKQISSDLVVNPSTVSRALRELEHIGIVTSLPGRGAFISPNGTAQAAKHAAADTVRDSFDASVREARALGLQPDAVRDAFERAYARWYIDSEENGENA